MHFFESMSMAASSVFLQRAFLGGENCAADNEHCGNLQQLHQVLAIPDCHISRPRRKTL